MEKVTITTYISFDNKKFKTSNGCIRHEENIMLNKIKDCGFTLYDEYGNKLEIKAGNQLKEVNDAFYYILEKPFPEDAYNYYRFSLEPGVYYWDEHQKGWESALNIYNILNKVVTKYKKDITKRNKKDILKLKEET